MATKAVISEASCRSSGRVRAGEAGGSTAGIYGCLASLVEWVHMVLAHQSRERCTDRHHGHGEAILPPQLPRSLAHADRLERVPTAIHLGAADVFHVSSSGDKRF